MSVGLVTISATAAVGLCASAPTAVIEACRSAVAHLDLPAAASSRVDRYVAELLAYNERTNVYSKAAYGKLPFHVADSVTLALHVRDSGCGRGVLDLGSGSGLPSLLLACVEPALPVFAVESKSRKTRFLERAAAVLELPLFVPLTSDVNELSRRSYFDVDHVTAKAFKPLEQVAPIAAACVRESALLQVPISTQQVSDLGLAESSLLRRGRFVYYHERIVGSRETASRTPICAPRRAR